jgi:hypothetical protein
MATFVSSDRQPRRSETSIKGRKVQQRNQRQRAGSEKSGWHVFSFTAEVTGELSTNA